LTVISFTLPNGRALQQGQLLAVGVYFLEGMMQRGAGLAALNSVIASQRVAIGTVDCLRVWQRCPKARQTGPRMIDTKRTCPNREIP
jgi:hypothetical protein